MSWSSSFDRPLHLNGLILRCIVPLVFACGVIPTDIGEDQTTKPNIVIILTDDMGYADLGCMDSEISTPHIDQIASNGLLFTHCYNASRCCPSRASLLTGLYQHAAGVGFMVADYGTPAYQGFLNDRCLTIAEALSPRGYATNMSGKWHLGGHIEQWPDRRGFERFYGLPDGGGVYYYPYKFRDRPLFKNGEPTEVDTTSFYCTDDFTTAAIEFIDQSHSEDKPFFLYLAHIAPHFPLQAWPEDINKYKDMYDDGYAAIRASRFTKQKQLGIVQKDIDLSPLDYADWSTVDTASEAFKMAVYAAQVDRLDQNTGRLTTHLQSLNILANTLIFFLSDNGASAEEINESPQGEVGTRYCFESHGKSWANVSNTPFMKYKKYEHEGRIITPLIIHWPRGISTENRLVHAPVHIIDIMPTILDIAEVQYPAEQQGKMLLPLDGRSFLPLLKGNELQDEAPLFWEHRGNKAVRSGSYKLVNVHNDDWELYDLSIDPVESNDISYVNTGLVDSLQNLWNGWAQAKGV
ncbi:MAG: arylsulfatase [Saprospiraceae bacterium]|nr:arylsulfatase [Saprospiraceae bacterium]